MIVVRLVILLGSFPVLAPRCHEGESHTAVYIRIGDTLASCCRGNNAKDANIVNYERGKCHKSVSPTAVHIA